MDKPSRRRIRKPIERAKRAMAGARSRPEPFPPPLDREQIASLLQLLPRPIRLQSDYTEFRIESARGDLWRAIHAEEGREAIAKFRRDTISSLEGLTSEADDFLAGLLAVRGGALRLLKEEARRHWDTEEYGEPIDRGAAAVSGIRDAAAQVVCRLREEASARGRPRKAAEYALALDLSSLWERAGGKLAHDSRPRTRNGNLKESRRWPFLDFVNAVGRSVSPSFGAEGAARRLLRNLRGTKSRT